MDPLFPKLWTVLDFHSLAFSVRSSASRVQRPEFRVQRPESKVQRPESNVQCPECSVQSPESSIQSPASNSCVQSPGIPVCLVFIHSFILHSFTSQYLQLSLKISVEFHLKMLKNGTKQISLSKMHYFSIFYADFWWFFAISVSRD